MLNRESVDLYFSILVVNMDALKSAGRAIIRSPSMAKQSWNSGKHKSKYSRLVFSLLFNSSQRGATVARRFGFRFTVGYVNADRFPTVRLFESRKQTSQKVRNQL